MKAYDDATQYQKERFFKNNLRAARVVSQHGAEGSASCIKTECRGRHVSAVIMACITLHIICIKRADPCLPRCQVEIENLQLPAWKTRVCPLNTYINV